jgi:hypothetical protein
MRGILSSCLIAAALAFVAPQVEVGPWPSTETVVAAQEPQRPGLDVDVDVDEGGAAWYMNPLWMALGGFAVLLLVLIIVFAARGGGTTVIKD